MFSVHNSELLTTFYQARIIIAHYISYRTTYYLVIDAGWWQAELSAEKLPVPYKIKTLERIF